MLIDFNYFLDKPVITLFENIVNSFDIGLLTEDANELSKNTFVLIFNKKDYIVASMGAVIIFDPYFDLTNEEINALDDENYDLSDYFSYLDLLDENFIFTPDIGYAFFDACVASGYIENEQSITSWFIDKLNRVFVQTFPYVKQLLEIHAE